MAELSNRILNASWTLTWQTTVVAVAVSIAAALVARRRPHLAAVLWVLVIVKCLTPPVWATSFNVWSLGSRFAPPAPISQGEGSVSRPIEPVNDAPIVTQATSQPEPVAAGAVQPFAATLPVDSSVPGGTARATVPPSAIANTIRVEWPTALLGLWLLGIVLFAVIAAGRFLRLRAVVSRSERSAALKDRIARMARVSLGVPAGPGASVGIPGARAAFGVLRPRIVLPRKLARSLTSEQLDAVLTHELTHLRRHDVLLGWLQTLAQMVWWFHPAVWFANRRLTQAIEESCDLETLHRLQCRAVDYARCLLAVMEHQALRPALPLPVGIRAFEATRSRVERVLQRRAPAVRSALMRRAILVVALLAVLPGASIPVGGGDSDTTAATAQSDGAGSPSSSRPNPALSVEESNAHILSVLDEPIDLRFSEVELSKVMRTIADARQVNTSIDVARLEDVGLSARSKVSGNVSGISLRSALTLLLRDAGGGKLAFIVADGMITITTAQAAGAPGQLRVTRLLSPDGTHIAYGQVAVGPGGEQRVRIIVGNADGTDRRALPVDAHAVDEVQWYGNDRIAYVTEHGEDGYRLMSLDGNPAGELRMPAGCDSFFHQCLSPDGKKIAFCGNYHEIGRGLAGDDERRRFLKDHPEIEGKHGLFVADLESHTVKQLLEETVANMPVWSDDSRFLACGIGHYVKNYPLVIINAESGHILRPDTQGVGPAWSPDNKRLALTTNVVRGGSWLGGIPLDGALGVWTIDPGSMAIVSPEPTSVAVKEPYSWTYSGGHSPVWSPDGQWVAYTWSEHFKGADDQSAAREEVRIVRGDGGDQRKVLDHRAEELAWSPDGGELLWVRDGQFGRVRVDSPNVAAATPAEPIGRWKVFGRVKDEAGSPLEGVSVTVARGAGTLFRSPPVLTDADGRYEIAFGPGVAIAGTGPKLQAATVHAQKAGYFEKDLCSAGNLGMAEYKPVDGSDKEWGFAGVVYPGQPHELDLVMVGAAQVDIELVSSSGAPLVEYNVDLDGEDLYPSSSVMQVETTDASGRARFADVPRRSYWFSLDSRRTEYKSAPFAFDQPGEYAFKLTYDDIAATLTAECTKRP